MLGKGLEQESRKGEIQHVNSKSLALTLTHQATTDGNEPEGNDQKNGAGDTEYGQQGDGL